MDTSTALALVVVALIGAGAGAAIGYAVGVLRPRPDPDAGRHDDRLAAVAEQAVVRESLDRLHDQMRDLEHTRVSWQGQLHQQVNEVRHSTDVLRRETQSLSTALRRPQVRGRWGELHLRRVVELAGMVAHCDFTEQAQLDDGVRRPDLVVHLSGGRQVVVDAKTPLDAFLEATSSDDEELRAHHLVRHARALRRHVDQLGAKSYWRSLEESPELVVLFLPAESFLAAALETDPGLLEHAALRKVILATPSTLIALLRTVAHGWTHEALGRQAAEIHRLGRELHARLRTMNGHLDQVGRSLNQAVGHYNSAVGSLDARVLVAARRFEELSVTDDDLPAPRAVELRAVAPADAPAGTRRADPEEERLDRTVGT